MKNRFFGRKFHSKNLKNHQIEVVGHTFLNALYENGQVGKVEGRGNNAGLILNDSDDVDLVDNRVSVSDGTGMVENFCF